MSTEDEIENEILEELTKMAEEVEGIREDPEALRELLGFAMGCCRDLETFIIRNVNPKDIDDPKELEFYETVVESYNAKTRMFGSAVMESELQRMRNKSKNRH